MNPVITLSYIGGYLRILDSTDVHPAYVSGLNDPEVNRYLDEVRRKKQTIASVTEFVLQNKNSKEAVLWGIWQEGFANHCGTIRLHSVDSFHKVACVGICLFDKSAWGNRIGSKAIRVVTQWGFDYLNLRWIEAAAHTENISSQKSFLNAGYQWVYTIPGKYFIDGKYIDTKVFAARNFRNFAG